MVEERVRTIYAFDMTRISQVHLSNGFMHVKEGDAPSVSTTFKMGARPNGKLKMQGPLKYLAATVPCIEMDIWYPWSIIVQNFEAGAHPHVAITAEDRSFALEPLAGVQLAIELACEDETGFWVFRWSN